jgi:hypothetical protein
VREGRDANDIPAGRLRLTILCVRKRAGPATDLFQSRRARREFWRIEGVRALTTGGVDDATVTGVTECSSGDAPGLMRLGEAPSEAELGAGEAQQELRPSGLYSWECLCGIACNNQLTANYPSSLTGKLFGIDLFIATRMVDT